MAGLFKSLAADPTTFADAGGTRKECLALSQPHPSGGAYDAARRTMRLLLPRASADPAQHCPEYHAHGHDSQPTSGPELQPISIPDDALAFAGPAGRSPRCGRAAAARLGEET